MERKGQGVHTIDDVVGVGDAEDVAAQNREFIIAVEESAAVDEKRSARGDGSRGVDAEASRVFADDFGADADGSRRDGGHPGRVDAKGSEVATAQEGSHEGMRVGGGRRPRATSGRRGV